jgi:hypothetical protein
MACLSKRRKAQLEEITRKRVETQAQRKVDEQGATEAPISCPSRAAVRKGSLAGAEAVAQFDNKQALKESRREMKKLRVSNPCSQARWTFP